MTKGNFVPNSNVNEGHLVWVACIVARDLE